MPISFNPCYDKRLGGKHFILVTSCCVAYGVASESESTDYSDTSHNAFNNAKNITTMHTFGVEKILFKRLFLKEIKKLKNDLCKSKN